MSTATTAAEDARHFRARCRRLARAWLQLWETKRLIPVPEELKAFEVMCDRGGLLSYDKQVRLALDALGAEGMTEEARTKVLQELVQGEDDPSPPPVPYFCGHCETTFDGADALAAHLREDCP